MNSERWPEIAYQTYVVHVIMLFNVALALVAGNVDALGITHPWLTLFAIPFLVAAGTYAANQMKSIGSPPPSTVRTETVTEHTATPPKP